ncbi:MAG: hypothetical protein U0470_04070 [Anaerolineae bacterium]
MRGTIVEDSALPLTSAVLEVAGAGGERYALDLGPYLSSPREFPSGVFAFAVRNITLNEGRNTLTVRAADAACPPHEGTTSVDVSFAPPPPALNLYALGVEITQGIQERVHSRGLAREVADPRPFWPQPYEPAVPLVAGKRTVVRVYGAVEGARDPVLGVPAALVARRGGRSVTLSAMGIAVNPADEVIDGVTKRLDLAATLEIKRADLRRGWSFVLPADMTEDGVIDRLEAQINPGALSGPVECLGCNDAANRLAVAGIAFRDTPGLAIRSYYVKGDGQGGAADAETFCGGFLNMFPVREGCGSGPADRNGLGFGLNLLSLTQETVATAKGDVQMDRGYWQDTMCKRIVADKRLARYVAPVTYVALGPDGLGGSPGNGIVPAACASTPFPGYYDAFRYGVAAQEVGHGDFTSAAFGNWWHACGPNEAVAKYPAYANAAGEPYYKGSIGHFGLDTHAMAVLNPAKVTDFMGYTYCDRWIADRYPESPDTLYIRAMTSFRVGASLPLGDANEILKGPLLTGRTVQGLSFILYDRLPGSSVRRPEATIRVSGEAKAGDLFVQVDDRPAAGLTLDAGDAVGDVAYRIREALNLQAGIPADEREPFAAYPWVSPYTFRLMFDQFAAAERSAVAALAGMRPNRRSATGEPIPIAKDDPLRVLASFARRGATRLQAQGDFFLVGGRIEPDGGARIDPIFRLSLPPDAATGGTTGSHGIVLLDAAGRELLVHRFAPTAPHHDQPPIATFFEIVPNVPGTASIVLRGGAAALATVTFSAHAPTVRLLSPAGGETWAADGRRSVEWTASDEDGDPLTFMVQYSRDAGATWQTIASDVSASPLTIDPATLPASGAALLRVLASDGANSAIDTVPVPFSVANKPPRIWISGAADDDIVAPGGRLNLQANILDPDGDLPADEDYVWSSSQQGVLGHGTRLVLNVAALAPGRQRLVLTVPGADGPAVSASVWVLRAPLAGEIRGATIYLPTARRGTESPLAHAP